MSNGWSYGCCKTIDNAACIECSDCGDWWHHKCLINSYNYRQVQLDSFAGDGEIWLCPTCYAGQEQGYCVINKSFDSPSPSKRKRRNRKGDLDFLNDDQQSIQPSRKNKSKSNSEYRFKAINIAWDDQDAPVQKVSLNKPYDATERFIAIKCLAAITDAIQQGKMLDVTLDFGVTNEIAAKVKVIYDKTISGDRKLLKYRPRTARSLKDTLHKIASPTGKSKYPKAHALISPVWIKYTKASTTQKHSGKYTAIHIH